MGSDRHPDIQEWESLGQRFQKAKWWHPGVLNKYNEFYVDGNAVRARAMIINVVALVILTLSFSTTLPSNTFYGLAPFMMFDFAVSAAFGLTPFCPTGVFATFLLWVFRSKRPHWEGIAPKRFAWGIGFALAITILGVRLALGQHVAVKYLILVAAIFTWLEGALGFCVGCKIYFLLGRMGFQWFKEACPECSGGACPLPQKPRSRAIQTEDIELGWKKAQEGPIPTPSAVPSKAAAPVPSLPVPDVRVDEVKVTYRILNAGELTMIQSEQDFDKALQEAGSSLVIVGFFATWCHPCKQMKPSVVKFAQDIQSTGTLFCGAYVDELEELSDRYTIQKMPTFGAFRNGQIIEKFEGSDVPAFQAFVKKHLGSAASVVASTPAPSETKVEAPMQQDKPSAPVAAVQQPTPVVAQQSAPSTSSSSTLAKLGELTMLDSEADFDKTLNELKSSIVVVGFFATWCQPCKQMKPHVIKMAGELKNKNAYFVGVYIDEIEELADRFDIAKMPTFGIFAQSEIKEKFEGSDHAKLRALVNKYL